MSLTRHYAQFLRHTIRLVGQVWGRQASPTGSSGTGVDEMDMISRITDKVLEELAEWQKRPIFFGGTCVFKFRRMGIKLCALHH